MTDEYNCVKCGTKHAVGACPSRDDLEFRRWVARAARENGHKIERSSCFLSLFSGNYAEDPVAALQLGIAMSLDKPLYFAVPHGTKLPSCLERAAAGVEYYDPKSTADMERAVRLLTEKGLGR